MLAQFDSLCTDVGDAAMVETVFAQHEVQRQIEAGGQVLRMDHHVRCLRDIADEQYGNGLSRPHPTAERLDAMVLGDDIQADFGQPVDPDRNMVRGRVRGHLDALKQRFPRVP